MKLNKSTFSGGNTLYLGKVMRAVVIDLARERLRSMALPMLENKPGFKGSFELEPYPKTMDKSKMESGDFVEAECLNRAIRALSENFIFLAKRMNKISYALGLEEIEPSRLVVPHDELIPVPRLHLPEWEQEPARGTSGAAVLKKLMDSFGGIVQVHNELCRAIGREPLMWEGFLLAGRGPMKVPKVDTIDTKSPDPGLPFLYAEKIINTMVGGLGTIVRSYNEKFCIQKGTGPIWNVTGVPSDETFLTSIAEVNSKGPACPYETFGIYSRVIGCNTVNLAKHLNDLLLSAGLVSCRIDQVPDHWLSEEEEHNLVKEIKLHSNGILELEGCVPLNRAKHMLEVNTSNLVRIAHQMNFLRAESGFSPITVMDGQDVSVSDVEWRHLEDMDASSDMAGLESVNEAVTAIMRVISTLCNALNEMVKTDLGVEPLQVVVTD